ncbi:MAG: fused MFS/spermidine synthase [Acidobacteria bacterium]|nr:fused MFS/spermidine synthase [Acidobacteriota bacterium]
MLLFASTIFTSAFLLFLVQPMIAKKILPWFGGSAAVWTTCMLFFQIVLLLGYLYSHWSIRYWKPKRQIMVHLGLLALSLLLLPLAPNPLWRISGDQDPALRILALLATSVGLPYFLLSTTGPLLQAWYARRSPGSVPYRLYSLSNLGSMLALLGYPALMEPWVFTHTQLLAWSAGYVLFVILCAAVAWKTRPAGQVAAAAEALPAAGHVPWQAQGLWVLLSACSSALLLAITNHLCQDVAAMPFLWVLPLALYLLSFVLCFERDGWYRRIIFLPLLVVALSVMAYSIGDTDRFGLRMAIPMMAAGLFVCCMFCHGELAARKPDTANLTSFYLMISLGGALGAMFVAMLAPRVFSAFYELPIGLAACAVLASTIAPGSWKLQLPWAVFAVVFAGYVGYEARSMAPASRLLVRNFYGSLRVSDVDDESGFGPERKLVHGTINHGVQLLTAEFRRTPTTYYGNKSGVGLAILNTRRPGQRVGVIGLGTGTLAAYGRSGDDYRFYEINPSVVSLARSQFTYLSDTPAKVDVVLGDARLSLEREASQQFDVLVVDAFSGDSIPVHLLTRESFEVYYRHLRPGGVLAVHVSNRYLTLEPVVQKLADVTHRQTALIDTDDGEYEVFEATWVLVTNNQGFLNSPDVKAARKSIARRPDLVEWTDDFSNLFQIVKWRQ